MKHIQKLAKVSSIAIISGFLGTGLAACEQKGPAERAGEQVDDALDEAKEAIGDAAEEGADRVEDAGDAIEDKADEAEEKLED